METQEKLLDIGEAVMRTKGFAGFSYADIASEAGIRKASIHHHFPKKADLTYAALVRYAERMAAKFADIEARSRLGSHAILAAVQFYRDATNDAQQTCLCVALSADARFLDERIAKTLAAANRMALDWFERMLAKGRADLSVSVSGLPADEAAAVLAQLQGAQLLAMAEKSLQAFDRATAVLVARASGR